MFRKILIANRGEIAMRIIRGCRELNIATAAIYSEADSSGIYVKKADESYLVGPGPVKGFLDGKQIVEIAKRIGADAIHPGYGFLSENTKFARLCQTSGITFIGPSPETIDLMGSKVKARQIAQQAGLPIVPGTKGGVTSVEAAKAEADAAAAAQAAAESELADRQANCGAIRRAPDVCPTTAELSAYQAAVAAARQPKQGAADEP